MSTSKQLVYLPHLRKDTWLLMSKRLSTVHIREYSSAGVEIIEKMDLETANELLADPESFVERVSCFNRAIRGRAPYRTSGYVHMKALSYASANQSASPLGEGVRVSRRSLPTGPFGARPPPCLLPKSYFSKVSQPTKTTKLRQRSYTRNHHNPERGGKTCSSNEPSRDCSFFCA